MKVYLRNHDYTYAVIQTALSLFPESKPKQVDSPPKKGEDSIVSAIFYGQKYTTATCRITYGGKSASGMARLTADSITDDILRSRLSQRVIKQAIYRAAVKTTGAIPPWGALSGVRPSKLATRELLSGGDAASADRLLRDVFFVTKERRRLAIECAEYTVGLSKELLPRDVSLYIGIPFCPSRCNYCSFFSQSAEKSGGLIEPFLEALKLELEATAEVVNNNHLNLRTIYMGGGTPTTLSTVQLEGLFSTINSLFELSNLMEFTVEAGRPDTLDFEKLKALRELGVTRISVNPQSMVDSVLSLAGRGHTAEETEAAFFLARQAGHDNINMDLIAGLSGDSLEGFRYTIDKVLSLAPESITVHTLALKRGSELMLSDAVPSGNVVPAGNVGLMLDYSRECLRGSGYKPYYLYRQKYMSGSFENIGWSRIGARTESPYNVIMMEELHTVLSCGGGGTTKLVAPGGKISRLGNPKHPSDYIRDIEKVISGKRGLLKN